MKEGLERTDVSLGSLAGGALGWAKGSNKLEKHHMEHQQETRRPGTFAAGAALLVEDLVDFVAASALSAFLVAKPLTPAMAPTETTADLAR